MKSVKNRYTIAAFLIFVALLSGRAAAQQPLAARSSADRAVVARFEKSADEYSKMRERLEEQLPTLPKDAEAQQIETHKMNFQKLVVSARQNAKQGELFSPAAAKLIRKIIKAEFKGKKLTELRQTVMEADNKGIALKVNAIYPPSKELVEMSPALLLALPQLPKQLRYRFVGRNLLLVDRENDLIIDYMTKALP